MKFYIGEKNIGVDTTRNQVDQVIEYLKKKGWDVSYGMRENEITSDDEVDRQDEISNAFADDFINCLIELGL